MRGSKARAIRRLVYGPDLSPRARQYTTEKVGGGTRLSAGLLRRRYQWMKRWKPSSDFSVCEMLLLPKLSAEPRSLQRRV